MMKRISLNNSGLLASAVLMLGMLAGCGTTTTKPVEETPASNIEVVEAVGFTIVEERIVPEEVDFAYQDALRRLEQGMLDGGIAQLEQVTESAPDFAAPRINLGIAHHVAGDLEAAEAELTKAIELNPMHPVAHNELGIIYRKTGRFAEARSSYEAALSIYPGYHHARKNLAILCDLYLSDQRCAMDNYEAYMSTVPNDPEVDIWMADLRIRMGN